MEKKEKKTNPHIGSSFADFLRSEGVFDEVTSTAIKRVLVWQLTKAMEEKKLTKSALAKAMGTSRAAVNRLLDPDNPSATLASLQKAATAVGRRLVVRLEA